MGPLPEKQTLSRRALLRGAALTPALCLLPDLLAARRAWAAAGRVMIYSPAPATTSLHALNMRLLDAAGHHSALKALEVAPLALPESINNVAGLPPGERAGFWPIITSIDLGMARSGKGPKAHGYPRVNSDLKFVARLCDVGFGIAMWGPPVTDPQQLRGKRIAVPGPGSSVRVLTEILLRDGWGIAKEVVPVVMAPGEVAAARKAGLIDGTSWGLVGPTPDGHKVALPQDPSDPFHHVPVDEETLARINNVHQSFKLARTSLLKDGPPLLSFAQGLAVWDEADPSQVTAMLEFLEQKGAGIRGMSGSVAEMAAWPALSADIVHPAALSFYRSRGITI